MAARNWGSHRVDPVVPGFRRLPHKLLLPWRPANLFGRGRRSDIRLRFRGNSRYVICHAALVDIRLFSHIVFHHFFLIGSPFIVAILRGFLRALSVRFEWCGDGSRRGGVWLGRLRICTKMRDCDPGKRATKQTNVLFHLSAPWHGLYREEPFLNTRPCLQPFHSWPRTKPMRNPSRRFQLREPRSGISSRAWPIG